jgi:phosphatidylinositol glycan class M
MAWTHNISFTTVLVFSAAIRAILIVYAEWHDAHSVVKYTDVDYRVFGDATRFILHPEGGQAQGHIGSLLGLGE